MLRWTRVENWEGTRPKFVELAVDGAVLWQRDGTIQAGRQPTVERRELASAAAAEAALQAELTKLRRLKFGELTTFERAAPAPEELARKEDPALGRYRRWAGAEASEKKRAFFARLVEIGIDPTKPFRSQASPGGRAGTDGAERRDRDADARVGAALRVAREVLGVQLFLKWQQQHDGDTLSDVFDTADRIFERASRKRR